MRYTLYAALLVGAMTLGTVGFGWWAVPLAGAAAGAWRSGKGLPVVEAGVAAALAWGILIAIRAATGPLGGLSGLLGELFGLPGIAIILVTLVFAALVAGSAAGLTESLVALSTRVQHAEDGVDR